MISLKRRPRWQRMPRALPVALHAYRMFRRAGVGRRAALRAGWIILELTWRTGQVRLVRLREE